jgi:6-pyruvoyltetrahydropterin/6-carboxytetrahydropterin synthase
MNDMTFISVGRKVHFNAAHRLNNSHWSEEKNRKVFGKCNNPNYHGHNYILEAKIKGKIDPETGYVIDMGLLKELLEKEIVERFDHKNLNLDVDLFAHLNPTAENIAIVIYNLIKPKIHKDHQLTIILHETERNYVEYAGQ